VREQAPVWERLEEAVPRDLFLAEVTAWARRIAVEPREVHVRPMRRKWGSCSTSGRVTFNAELLAQPAAFRRRVIVEELLHLKVPNHGRLFRSLLKAYLGEAAANASVGGRPVAPVVPLPAGSALDRLLAAGEIEAATGELADLAPPLDSPPEVERPSVVLARLRRDER